jgi:A/G-specific adenine glycosylase
MPSFAARLIRWHKRHGRHDLPWQQTRDPYRVWLSEIMLQQTQVTTVIPYYLRFLERFPDLASLAAAPGEEVMGLWSGLGYYARARNLHGCAKAILEHHGGEFPRDPETIATLAGIGRSTANAIAVFCFRARAPILDGNVKRVLCRHAGIEGFPGAPSVEKELWQLAESLLPAKAVDTYIQAQMDLGATICTRTRPDCAACPLREDCIAQRDGRTSELPAARPRKPVPEKEVTLLLFRQGKRILVEPRPPTGIWGSLWSLPEMASESGASKAASRRGLRIIAQKKLPTLTHTFTHFRLRMHPLLCEVEAIPQAASNDARWLGRRQLASAPLPAPIRKLLTALLDQPAI